MIRKEDSRRAAGRSLSISAIVSLAVSIAVGGLLWFALTLRDGPEPDPNLRVGSGLRSSGGEAPAEQAAELAEYGSSRTHDVSSTGRAPSVASTRASAAMDDREASTKAPPIVWSGRVVSATHGQPIEGAVVVLHSGSEETRTGTDSEGRFGLPVVPDGSRVLAIEHPDFVDAVLPRFSAAEHAEIELRPSASISGSVQPPPAAPGGSVTLFDLGDSSRFRAESPPSAPIASDGAFAFTDLSPGEYALVATAANTPEAMEVGVQLDYGERRTITIGLEPGVTLTGKLVLRDTETPVADALLTVRPSYAIGAEVARELEQRTTTSAADGSYRFEGLLAAPQRIFVVPPWGGEQSFGVDLSSELGERREDFELSGPAMLSGTVLGPEGKPVDGARVLCLAAKDFPDVESIDAEAFIMCQEESTTGGDGSFSLEAIPAREPLALIALPPKDMAQEASIVHVRVGPFPAGHHADSIVLRLTPVLVMRGVVTDEAGQAIPDASIEAAYDGRYGTIVLRRSRSDAEGSFVLTNLTEGKVRVRASAPGRCSIEARATILAGAPSPEVSLVLPPARDLHVLTIDPEGRALSGVRVRVAADPDWVERNGGERPPGLSSARVAGSDGWGLATFEALPYVPLAIDADSGAWTLVESDPPAPLPPDTEEVSLHFVERERPLRSSIVGSAAIAGTNETPQSLRIGGFRGGVLSWNGEEFTIEGTSPTTRWLYLRARNCAPTSVGPLELQAGSLFDLGRVEMEPLGNLVLHLRDHRGDPVVKARVEMVPPGSAGRSRRDRVTLEDDGEGRYKTHSIWAGEWQVRVNAPGHPEHREPLRLAREKHQSHPIRLPRPSETH